MLKKQMTTNKNGKWNIVIVFKNNFNKKYN